MSSHLQSPPPVAADPATPEAIAAMRRHPAFPQALRSSARGLIAMHQGGRLINWLIDDRGRLLFSHLALYFHFTRDPGDPGSGITPTRMKAMCAKMGICSPGRAAAIIALMRLGGYLAPALGTDRRRRIYVATPRLIDMLVQRYRLHIEAMAPLVPDGAELHAAARDPALTRPLVIVMVKRFIAGFRFMTHVDAPALGLFAERNAGMLLLLQLVAEGEPDDSIPPSRPVPVSISALARRFGVSRPHIHKMLSDAAKQGLIDRSGPEGDRLLIKPALADALQDFWATVYLYLADCVREARAAVLQPEPAAL